MKVKERVPGKWKKKGKGRGKDGKKKYTKDENDPRYYIHVWK
jgi:hypothetical protein